MRIVHQSALVSHCLFPPNLLLPAPHIAGLLSAPRIAGLLPARVPSSMPEIVVIQPPQSRLARQRALWEAQDAELEAFFAGARQRLAAVLAEVLSDSAPRPVPPFFWEIAS